MVPVDEIGNATPTTTTSTSRAISTLANLTICTTSTHTWNGGIPDRDLDALDSLLDCTFPSLRQGVV